MLAKVKNSKKATNSVRYVIRTLKGTEMEKLNDTDRCLRKKIGEKSLTQRFNVSGSVFIYLCHLIMMS